MEWARPLASPGGGNSDGELSNIRLRVILGWGTSEQTWLTVKNAFSPNFHTEWSNSCLQDLANQTLLPLALPNYTANNFHCDWARWANRATQARQLFTSSCPSWLRRTGTAFFPVSQVWSVFVHYLTLCLSSLVVSYHGSLLPKLCARSAAVPRWPHRKPDLTLHYSLVVLSFLPSLVRSAASTLQNP